TSCPYCARRQFSTFTAWIQGARNPSLYIFGEHTWCNVRFRSWFFFSSAGYSSVGRAVDCRVLLRSIGRWFNSGCPDAFLRNNANLLHGKPSFGVQFPGGAEFF